MTPSEIAAKRKGDDRIQQEKQLDYVRSKPCIICRHGQIKEAIRVDLCGDQVIPIIEIPCDKCTIPNIYNERHERREIILHNPLTGSFDIDGGGPSRECTNFIIGFDV